MTRSLVVLLLALWASAGVEFPDAGRFARINVVRAAASLPPLTPAQWTSLGPAEAQARAGDALLYRLARPGYRESLVKVAVAAGRDEAFVARLERWARRAAATTHMRDAGDYAGMGTLLGLKAQLEAAGALEWSDLGAAFDGLDGKSSPAVAGGEAVRPNALSPRAIRPQAFVEPPPGAPPEKPPLGFFMLFAMGLNAIIGGGVFFRAGKLALATGVASVWSYPLTGLFLIPVGLCIAEATTYVRGNGGGYLMIKKAFGPKAAFAVGWSYWISMLFGWAAVAMYVAPNLAYFLPALGSPLAQKAVAMALIIIMAAINYVGAKPGARTTAVFTVGKLVPLAVFIVVGLAQLHAAAFHGIAPHALKPFTYSLFLTYFAFQGFETIPIVAGEAKNPAKTVPWAIVLSLIGSGLVYGAIQFAAVGIAPHLAQSATPLVDAAGIAMGPIGAAMMALGAAISTTGLTSGSAFSTPRLLQVLAAEGHLPVGLATTHPKFHTPARAIAATGVLALLLAAWGHFDVLVDASAIAVGAQLLAACVAVPFLRRQGGAPAGAFRARFGLLMPIVGAGVVIALTVAQAVSAGFGQLGLFAGLLALGFGLKAVLGRRD